MKKFVVVIDAQFDFMNPNGALPVPGADNIIEPLNAFLDALNPDDIEGILFTYDTHQPDVYKTSSEAELFPPHCIYGTNGWQLVVNRQLVDPMIPSYTLYKSVFNMWEERGIFIFNTWNDIKIHRDDFFDSLKMKGINEIILVGVASDFCVKWAYEGLKSRNFNITVPETLTKGIYKDINQVLEELE